MIIGLDVGGTHTDVVLLAREGVLNQVKVPTDPAELFHTVLAGLEKILEGVDASRIRRLVLSTTLTTNAIVQKKLPPVGMIVAGGPGVDPLCFRTNEHYTRVSGAIDHRGCEISPVVPAEIHEAARRFQKRDIRNVGVVSKFSVRNPTHEMEITRLLDGSFDQVFLGHRVSGNLSFPRRIATTYLNAAVHPIHREFFSAVEKSLEERGLSTPIRILKADGGSMNMTASMGFPAQTIFSGPAASVMGAMAHAPEGEESLVLDIGGTTTDMALLIHQAPVLEPMGIELGRYKTLIRALKTHSIGLGGDSVAALEGGRLKIGPERRGPAMAFGGPAPTPTDALVILNKMNTGDREKSVRGLASLADGLGRSIDETAHAIFDLTCKQIMAEAGEMIRRVNARPVYTVHEMLEGRVVKPRAIVALGGPAACFAPRLQTISGLQVDVAPRSEVANAVGAALSRTTCEVVLLADTQRKIAMAPNEDFTREIDSSFTREDAAATADALLRKKAIDRGASPDHLETEVLEDLQFNMIRGFHTVGKNIRIKMQTKPGLIREGWAA
ncbi:MAG: hydantoinase/oxoprolinase family protein [Desulfobacterales bacterium]|nr:hydantoinase/oxoprolinase family protein [Desulfobacterales bacterium]